MSSNVVAKFFEVLLSNPLVVVAQVMRVFRGADGRFPHFQQWLKLEQ